MMLQPFTQFPLSQMADHRRELRELQLLLFGYVQLQYGRNPDRKGLLGWGRAYFQVMVIGQGIIGPAVRM
jgi:hypothetical protein